MKKFRVNDSFVMQPAFQKNELPVGLETGSVFEIGLSEHRFSLQFLFKEHSFNISREDFLQKFLEDKFSEEQSQEDLSTSSGKFQGLQSLWASNND